MTHDPVILEIFRKQELLASQLYLMTLHAITVTLSVSGLCERKQNI